MKLPAQGSIFAILALFSLVFTPIATAQAQTDALIGNSQNSQNLTLMQATVSPNRDFGQNSSDITIENHSALLSQVGPLGTAADIKDEYLSDQDVNYTVRSGDTIPGVAKMFGISQNTIIWANNLKKGQALKEGDILLILPISGVEYTIKSGDTLKGIAKKYNGDIDEIFIFNDITEQTNLAVGDKIIIPDGEINGGTTSSPSVPKTPKPNYSGASYEGYYMRPIVGGIRTQGIHGHNGVDLASSYGANILASADGEVIISRSSGWNGGYGSYIVLKHGNGTQTWYGHLSATLVSVGDHVSQGQVIGRMGNTGQVKGPTGIHLHFEIRGAKNPF